ncbi:MAG: DUF47 family protein [Bacteroidales bacterium]
MAKTFLGKIFGSKQDNFFPMFDSMAEFAWQSANKFNGYLAVSSTILPQDLYNDIKALENQADDVVHHVYDTMGSTFVTPFDREDIQKLISKMDDIIDLLTSASQKILLYQPARLPARTREMAQLIVNGCEQIRIAVGELSRLKKNKKVIKAVVLMDQVEKRADDVFHEMLSDLFDHETNAVELIKNKKIFETLEMATDRIEDVADVFRTLMLKAS